MGTRFPISHRAIACGTYRAVVPTDTTRYAFGVPPGPTAVIAACAVGGAIGTIQGSTEPSAPCTESNVGEVERTYNFELSPVWLQILMGPPVCEVQVSTYQCSRV